MNLISHRRSLPLQGRKRKTFIAIYGLLAILQLVSQPLHAQTTGLPAKEAFHQKLPDGQMAGLFYLKSKDGKITAAVTTWGARLVYLAVPGKNGPVSIVAGFNDLNGYLQNSTPFYGALIGRTTGRITNGRITVDGKDYAIAPAFGPRVLHGGMGSFTTKLWTGKQLDEATVELTLVSPDGDGGYPGKLSVKAVYSLSRSGTLDLTFDATTDKATTVNLSNHFFFNLNGEGSGTINNHILQIDAAQYLPVTMALTPTGKIDPVAGTPFDFNKPRSIGSMLENETDQLKTAQGYDHTFLLTRAGHPDGLMPVASLTGDQSGIKMQIATTEIGLHLYGGNHMYGMNKLRTGKDEFRTALMIQPLHLPDASYNPKFPSIILRPGQIYHQQTSWTFTLVK